MSYQELRNTLKQSLLDAKQANGSWEGRLSTSALSTATAITALHYRNPEKNRDFIEKGLHWLAQNANKDGGWGDTTLGYSNISTSLLCWGAISLTDDGSHATTKANAAQWISNYAGSMEPKTLAKTVMDRYAEDHTFSVPILSMLCLCGVMGEDGWDDVVPLPFELATFPQRFFKWLNLNVVSYALPALIAIGQLGHHFRKKQNPITKTIRTMAKNKTLKLLESIQPSNGGFLEATPLTSFVTMSLAAMGYQDNSVAIRGEMFLKDQMREDGGWPIDTHLATWNTSLAINALSHTSQEPHEDSLKWLLEQQYQDIHPFTGASPGGWAWTPLPGGVPDADDTSGAVIALANLDPKNDKVRLAAEKGLIWLAQLQNRDGGIPTFCRGWGQLPFDQSCADITAHAILAFSRWQREGLEEPAQTIKKMQRFLLKNQKPEGYWLPLWFGNQDVKDEINPVYGTARVLIALETTEMDSALTQAVSRAKTWLKNQQNEDGGWGGILGAPSTVEETALALAAQASWGDEATIKRGLHWLAEATEGGKKTPAAQIGFYFANLWYFEDHYPHVFAVDALERLEKCRPELLR